MDPSGWEIVPEIVVDGPAAELVWGPGQGTRTPALFAGSPQSTRRFWEFFTAEIPNDHT